MSLRLLLATACLQHWKVCSFDVSGAYLYSPVEETVLMEPPTHFIPALERKVLHLWKALYGMKQVGRCWWLHLLGILEGLGLTSCEAEMSLYVFQRDETIMAIWIHIDDGMITSNSPTEIKRCCEALCKNFEIKWLTKDILDAYPRRILQHDSPLPPIPTTTSSVKGVVMDPTPFRLVVGLLAYLVSGLRPDLAFAMNYLVRHSTAPTAAHWAILDHLVGYLLKTRGHSIILCPEECALNLWSEAGTVAIGLHAQTWQCTHFVGLKMTNRGGPINMRSGIYCAIRLNTTAGTGDKPTDTTGPKLQEDNLL
ncbi:hypothetical protein O181_076202 [Austropuccinia psidii MF-1]|uniref:Reverse transcriptase Ty1/copia-type domain-containing protein n=1 Tax=Austropuccinia psidii MF-1 TaxID=1389203 RepID=A0A9Q3IDK4_9BASI|nr:hypothetical protein [Austropuccinia psidii MF-1]